MILLNTVLACSNCISVLWLFLSLFTICCSLVTHIAPGRAKTRKARKARNRGISAV